MWSCDGVPFDRQSGESYKLFTYRFNDFFTAKSYRSRAGFSKASLWRWSISLVIAGKCRIFLADSTNCMLHSISTITISDRNPLTFFVAGGLILFNVFFLKILAWFDLVYNLKF